MQFYNTLVLCGGRNPWIGAHPIRTYSGWHSSHEPSEPKPCEVSGPFARSSSVKEAGEQESYPIDPQKNVDSSYTSSNELPKSADDRQRLPRGRTPANTFRTKKQHKLSGQVRAVQLPNPTEHPTAGRRASTRAFPLPVVTRQCRGDCSAARRPAAILAWGLRVERV